MDENITAELPGVPQIDPSQDPDAVTKPTAATASAAAATEGEGSRSAARAYDADAEAFVASGRVQQAARDARAFVTNDPAGAAKAERDAKRGPGPHFVSVDELVAKGRTVVDRVVEKVRNAIKK